MILILTYHKIATGRTNDAADFYTITRDGLESQLCALRTRGYRCLGIDELLRDSPPVRPFPDLPSPLPSGGEDQGEGDIRTTSGSDGPPPQNSCLLTFDDGTQDHYDIALPLLEEHKFQGVFFVCTGKFDLPGFLTRAQVREIAQRGHIIGCHSDRNHRLDRLTDEQIRERIALSRQVLTEVVGASPVLFAPPGGYINDRVRKVVLANGMRIIRTMQWGYNDRPDLAALQCIPMNRNIGPKQFNDILDRRRAGLLTVSYRIKEFVKWVLPSRVYHGVREAISATHDNT